MEYYNALKFALAEYRCIRRKGWNASNQFVFFVPSNHVDIRAPEQVIMVHPDMNTLHIPGFLCIKTANGMIVPWLCSATDAIASDWEIVPVATKQDEAIPLTEEELLRLNEEQLKKESE